MQALALIDIKYNLKIAVSKIKQLENMFVSHTYIVLLVEPVPTAGTSLSQLKFKTYTPA